MLIAIRPRQMVAAMKSIVAGLLIVACTGQGARGEPVDLVLYSPAPPNIMLDAHNRALGHKLSSCDAFSSVEVVPIALPEAIDMIRAVDTAERPYHLPIMTVPDFQTAIDGSAPAWHAYEPAAPDLKFVTSLYDVVFGILAFDAAITSPEDLRGKRIAVPARASSVRWLTEVLLRDGWGILDEVTLVDIAPPNLPGAVQRGEIDATSWSIMSETPDGFLPMIPPLLAGEGVHWINVDEEVLGAINDANPFQTELTAVSTIAGVSVPEAILLSFRQGLAAWSDTPDDVISEILSCLEGAELGFGQGSYSASDRFNWPGLDEADIHPASLKK